MNIVYMSYDLDGQSYTWQINNRIETRVYDFLQSLGATNIISRI